MGVEIDSRISHGNLLVLAGMIASIAVAWGSMSGKADNAFEKIATNRAAIAAQESRIRAVEQSTARQDERMVLILESLRKIEKQFEQRGYLAPPFKGADHP